MWPDGGGPVAVQHDDGRELEIPSIGKRPAARTRNKYLDGEHVSFDKCLLLLYVRGLQRWRGPDAEDGTWRRSEKESATSAISEGRKEGRKRGRHIEFISEEKEVEHLSV